VGIIKMIADGLASYIHDNLILGSTYLYWTIGPVVGVVEHDAFILAFLYIIRDLAATAGINPWNSALRVIRESYSADDTSAYCKY